MTAQDLLDAMALIGQLHAALLSRGAPAVEVGISSRLVGPELERSDLVLLTGDGRVIGVALEPEDGALSIDQLVDQIVEELACVQIRGSIH